MTERFGLGISNCRPALEVIDGVERAEGLGAEVAFVAEDIGCRDAFQLLAGAAATTERIRLATGVINPYTRNPTSVAMAVVTLDELSRGRAVLGMGSSSPHLIEEQMGIIHGPPVRVMRESAEIVRALLRGDEVTYAGERFQYQRARLQTSSEGRHVPIFFAAMGPRTLRLAGRMADGVLLNVGATAEYVTWAVVEIKRGAEQAGRDSAEITVAAWLTTYVSDDRGRALDRAKRWLAHTLSIPRQGELLLEHAGGDPAVLLPIRERVQAYPHGGDPAAAVSFVSDELAERMTLIGDVAEVKARIAEYREAGVQIPVLSISALGKVYGDGNPLS